MIYPLEHPGALGVLNAELLRLDREVTATRFVPQVAVAPTATATFRLHGEDGAHIEATIVSGAFTGVGTGSTTGQRFRLEVVDDAGARWFRGYAESSIQTGNRFYAPLIYPGTLAQGDRRSFCLLPYAGTLRRFLPGVAGAAEMVATTLRLKRSAATTDAREYLESALAVAALTGAPVLGAVPVSADQLVYLEATLSDGTPAWARCLAEVILATPVGAALKVVPVYQPGIISDADSILVRSPGVETTLRHFRGNFGVSQAGSNLQLTAEVEGSPGTTKDLTLADWETHGSQGGSDLTVPSNSLVRIRFVDLNGRQDYFRGALFFEAAGVAPASDIGLAARIRVQAVLGGTVRVNGFKGGLMPPPQLHVGSDNLVELRGLVTQDDGASVAAATVTMTLTHTDGLEVLGETWPLAMAADGQGNYAGVVRDSVSLRGGQEYRLEIIADDGADKRGRWVVPMRAIDRQN